jgi:hypothetical protein
MFVLLIFLIFNSFLLPHGLLYTMLLSPFFLYYTAEARYVKIYVGFVLISLGYSAIHFTTNYFSSSHFIDPIFYSRSVLMLLMQLSFVLSIHKYLSGREEIEDLMQWGLFANIWVTMAALLALATGIGLSVFWYLIPITPNIPLIPRLKGLTYEASYYALTYTPIFLYFSLKLIKEKQKKAGLLLAALVLPMILSFSLGVWMSLFLSWLGIMIWFFPLFFTHKRFRVVNLSLVLGLATLLIGLYIFYPENPLYIRFANILSGADTSARGRTYEAFDIAWKLAEMKSIWFGIGPGQIKGIGRDFIVQYYHYTNIPDVIRIPNAAAELLASYGILALIAKIGLEIFFFFKTRVFQNVYRFGLFLFIFIYQFTGSFISNIVEYAIWILVFSSVLTLFDVAQWKRIPGK